MLLAARVDPAGLLQFFETLMKGDKQPRTALKYFSTHPSTGDRIGRLRALAAEAPAPPVKLLPDQDWADLRQWCKAAGAPPRAP